MAAARWLALAPGNAKAQAAVQRVEIAQEEAARQQREAAAARERERLEAEKQRAAQEAAQRQAAAATAQRQQWEVEQAAAAARERERDRAEQVAAAQPAVYAPVQQPARQNAPERKAFPAWAWALLATVGLIGALWGLSTLANKPPAEPTVVEKTVVVTQEVVRVITATPAPEPETAQTAEATMTSGAHALGDTWTRPADGMVMVYVPAGEFQMGSTTYDDEEPVHTVALDAFWLDRTEVSVAQFRDFVNATRHETTAEQVGKSYVAIGNDWEQVSGADWAHPEGPGSQAANDHPVVHVSWNDAVAYCEWAGSRLLTEAEWEYAARGPEGLSYPWGNTFDGTRLNFCDKNCAFDWADQGVDDGYEFTAPVGSYPNGASWAGALDLAGNVWEWVADWYGDYSSERQVNPTGPASGDSRVLRGGSWFHNEGITRGAYRNWHTPPGAYNYLGFRCGVSAAPGQ